MRNYIRNRLVAMQCYLFRRWLMDEHERGHPVETVLYYSYIYTGVAANALRPR